MRRVGYCGVATVLVIGVLASMATLGFAAVGPPAAKRPPPASGLAQAPGTVNVEWLGWSHFRMTSPAGRVILTNPFVVNPDSPVKVEDITRADLIFAPNGHLDEIGSTVEIARRTGALVFAPAELLSWFIEQGVPEGQVPVRFANPAIDSALAASRCAW